MTNPGTDPGPLRPASALSRPTRPPVSVADLLVGLGVTLTGLLLFVGARQIPFGISAVVGPRLFPLIVSVGTAALGLALTVAALRGERAEPGDEEDTDPDAPVSHVNPAVILAGFLLGAALLPSLGFVFGTAIMYLSVTYAFGERRYARMAGIALLISVLTYLLFTRGLGLTLPAGLLRGVL